MNQNNYSFNNNSYDPFPGEKKPSHGFATAALVLGIVGAVISVGCCCCDYSYLVGILCGVLAIVFAALSKQGGKMSGSAIAGIVLGIIAVVVGIILVALDLYLQSLTPEELSDMFRALFGDYYDMFLETYEKMYGEFPIE